MTKTMKRAKYLLAFLAAAVLAIALAAPAFAADGDGTYSITINKDTTDKAAHTYGAYQVFTGDLATVDGNPVLSNIEWGANADGAAIIAALKEIPAFSSLASDATAADVAKAISDQQYTTDSEGARAIAEAINAGIEGDPVETATIGASETSGTITGLPAGYYLVKDTAAVSGEGAATKYILEVVKNVTVAEKASVPSVDKEIAETTPVKVSDYNIGDPIPYTITGTLPSNFEAFATYKTFTFTDTFADGLTPPAENAVTVTIGQDDITSLFNVTVNGQTMTVSLKNGVDLRTATHGSGAAFANNDQIVVSYSAVLNSDAVIGGTGNVNEVTLVFSNNPNSDGDGETGTTPPDKTVVFTYDIKALKVEATSDAPIDQAAYEALSDAEKADYVEIDGKYQKVQALEGAGFTLYKDSVSDANIVGVIETGSVFEFKGVDAGTYILSETTVPEGYNKVNDITIVVTAVYDTSTNPATIESLTCTPSSFVATASTGVIEGKILNEKGAVLPSTGGIGTTVFYIVGGIMVIGAAVFLISRRRAARAEKANFKSDDLI